MIKFIYEPPKGDFTAFEDYYIDCSDPPDMDKSGSLGDRQPEWANRMSDSCPECEMPYVNHKMDCSRGRTHGRT